MSEIAAVAKLYFGFFDREIIALLLTLPRIYAFLQVSQLLADTAVPRLPKTAAILSLSLIAVPINMAHVDAFDRSVVSFAFYGFKEYAIGFVLGYIVGWIFWAVQSAGAFIDNQRGAAIAASIDPLQGHETSPLGILFSQAFLTYVYVTGAMLPILGLLYQSFELWPATRGLPILSPEFPKLALAVADNALRVMLIVAAPIAAVMFLAEFALAIVSRFAPQVQVFILAMPIKSGLAIFMLIFYFSRLLPYATDQLATFRPAIDQFYAVMQFSAPPPGTAAPPAIQPAPAPGAPPPAVPDAPAAPSLRPVPLPPVPERAAPVVVPHPALPAPDHEGRGEAR
ncbi:type III secretion system export apparatus subunit SctT [Aureimonas leprariae]|uniref:EscT/YscT/HrcT family type III secretion system export apparatus protein n=1 Tax=Plantimonas leprariae TaxID=2615207 RepID=A0A7V7PL84_9HYPH|nr:type III secretion system export apparatus subunit SctT [Aureimonas leprariae]KAB0676843.1 EscT/YscT/HrcT family type III secretion system export apparatus protein [Aureimonas leprariae]